MKKILVFVLFGFLAGCSYSIPEAEPYPGDHLPIATPLGFRHHPDGVIFSPASELMPEISPKESAKIDVKIAVAMTSSVRNDAPHMITKEIYVRRVRKSRHIANFDKHCAVVAIYYNGKRDLYPVCQIAPTVREAYWVERKYPPGW